MRAVILAAGRGSRMKSLTDNRPKCLVELKGRSLLEWQIGALRAAGVEEIGIVTGYRHELLSGLCPYEFHNARWAETNMVSSLAEAAHWLEEGDCIVSYSDIFYEPRAIKLLLDNRDALALTYDPNWLHLWGRRFSDPLDDAETFRLNADGTLAEIGGRPTSLAEVEGQYMGLLRFTPAGWSEVMRLRIEMPEEKRDRMHMTGTIQHVIEAGRVPVRALPYTGQWGEVDSATDLELYKETADNALWGGVLD